MKKKTLLKQLWLVLSLLFVVGVFGSIFSLLIHAEDNSSTVPGNPTYTEDAFYYSDQYMWKVSLYVAKSDAVTKETSTMDEFYRIGNEAVYICPITGSWGDWVGGSRPSKISNVFFTKESKVETLKELNDKGGNVEALDPVEFTTMGGVYTLIDTEAPYVPQLNDGDIYNDGVIYGGQVGNINTVIEYFNNINTVNKILNYYANKQGLTRETIVKDLNFTINGESKTNWNTRSILPDAINGNPTNQVEWLVVYEPVSIVYVKDVAHPGSYYGYALTATDFAVTQIKYQMDWRYDETRWSAWAGLQPDAWKANDQRQHVSRLSHLLLGNAVITNTTWYGLTSGNGVDQDAAIPNNRWTSENEIKYGGWGMSRWLKPTPYETPKDYEFRPNTDVVIACPVFSNTDAIPGSELTATYEIDGQTYTDTVLCPQKRVTTSYFKWHTPNVDVETDYNLKISVSPYPQGTIQNGSEYVNKKVIVRPLEEKTPPDPKVDDKRPTDLPDTVVAPDPPITDDQPIVWDTAVIKSVTEISKPPYNNGNKVEMEIHTNRATQTLDFKNLDCDDVKQLTEDALGNGILTKYSDSPLTNEIIWTIEFMPKVMGINHYALTPTNTNLGAGKSYEFSITLEKKAVPEIVSITREPADAEVDPKEPMTLTIITNTTTDYLTIHSDLKNETDQISPITHYSDEETKGLNKRMDMNGDNKVDSDDLQIIKDHVRGVCKGATIPCGICGAQDIDDNGIIDTNDVTLVEEHIKGKCALEDCYFHGSQENRVIKNDRWEWTITYTPTISGDEILTFIPYGTSDIALVNGISKTICFIVKKHGVALIELFPDPGFAEDIRIAMNIARDTPINTINEKVVTEDDLLSVTDLTSPHAKNIEGVGQLINLITLNLDNGEKITEIPDEISLNTKLEVLSVRGNALTLLSSHICDLTGLKTLRLSNNSIATIPSEIGNLKGLLEFDIGKNQLTELPSEIGEIEGLKTLILNENSIETIPDNFSKLQSITNCNFSDNHLKDISAFYSRMNAYDSGWNFNRQKVTINLTYGGNSAHTDIGDPGMNTPEVLRDMYQSYDCFDYGYQTTRGVPEGMYKNIQFTNMDTHALWKNGTDINGEYTFNQQRLCDAQSGNSGTSRIQTNAQYFNGSIFQFNYSPGGVNPNNVERVYNYSNLDSGSFNIAIRGFSGVTSFPTWSYINGQDDIKWYATSNSANFYVNSINNNHPALMVTHIYAGGTGLGAKQYKVNQAMHNGFTGHRSGGSIVFDVSNPMFFKGQYTTERSKNYLDFAVWDVTNGQDDLRFYSVETVAGQSHYTVAYPIGLHNQGGQIMALLQMYTIDGIGVTSGTGYTKYKSDGLVLF